MNNIFEVTLWGCRGSSAANAPAMMKYGCNTSSVSVQCGDKILLFDGGTGIINFEREFYSKTPGIEKKEVHLFISHYHYDHIEGIPFMKLPYDKTVSLYIYGPRCEGKSCKEIFDQAFSPPFFPIPFVSEEPGRCRMHFVDLQAHHTYNPFAGIEVKTIPINHPGGSNGYRVDYGGRSFCYITDYEFEAASYGWLQPFIYETDLLVIDSHFNETTFLEGWGHSTWEQGVEIAKKEQVKRMVVFHHNTDYSDQDLDDIQKEVSIHSPSFFVGRDGMKITL